MPALKAPEAFFNATMRVYKGISLEVALFFAFFCIFCISFAFHFFEGSNCILSPPLLLQCFKNREYPRIGDFDLAGVFCL